MPRSAITDFLSVLSSITGLSAYSLRGFALAESYVGGIAEHEKEYVKLLRKTAKCVAAILEEENSAQRVARLLVRNEDVVPLTDEAQRLLPVTEAAVALGRDLAAIKGLVSRVTGLTAQAVNQTGLAQNVLLELQASSGQRQATRIVARVRAKLAADQAGAHAASLADPRRALHHLGVRDHAPLARRGHIGTAVATIERQWIELQAFVLCAAELGDGPPGDLRDVGLAEWYLDELRRSMTSDKRPLLAEFAAALNEARGDGHLRQFVESAKTDRYAPIVEAAGAMSRDVEAFLSMSVVLTGLLRVKLDETAQAWAYLHQTLRCVGGTLTRDLLERARVAVQAAVGDDSLLELTVRRRLFGDQKLGPIARATMKMWYVARWEPLTAWWYDQYAPEQPHPAGAIVVSAAAHKVGLVWGLIGAHPQAAHQPGYGSWSLSPKIDAEP